MIDMEIETVYRCPLCGQVFTSRKDAIKCRDRHKLPDRIEKVKYAPLNNGTCNYPDKIDVLFGNYDVQTYYSENAMRRLTK